MSTGEEKGGLGKYIVVYICMLAISGIEIVIASQHPRGGSLLASLLVLAFLGAFLCALMFMRLASEKHTLIVFVAVFTLFVLATINYGWTDSFRLLLGVPYGK
jgi:heme/copper-type cytochrome/quinol oxidase subunit 4